MGSSGIVGLTRVRRWYRWVHPRLFGSLGFALGVVGFIRGRWIHSGSRWVSFGSSGVVGITRVVGFIRGRWVYSGLRWGLLGSFSVVVFTPVNAGGRLVHPGSLGSLWFGLGVVGSIWGR